MKSAPNGPKLWKVITITFFAYLLGNFLFETLIELIEHWYPVSFSDALPFTRLGLLVVAIFIASNYWKKYHKTKKTSTLRKVIKITIGLAILAFIVVGILNNIRQPIGEDLARYNSTAKSYLDKNRAHYGRCKNSLTLGEGVIRQNAQSYVSFNTTEKQAELIDSAENKLIKKVEDECNPVVRKYEEKFKVYKITIIEIAKANRSLLDKMRGIDNMPDDYYFSTYTSLLNNISGPNDFVFSQEQVDAFYKQELGR